jgi:hypothetical protein
VKTLDGELGAIFKRWYPDIDIEVEEMPVAAQSLASPCSHAHGHLLAGVWSTLAEGEDRSFAHDNPIAFTG